jgi:UDP-N-acetylglucosamine 2-epimerase (non-hydrolysing)
VTLRYGTERPETAFVGANCVVGHDQVDIITGAIKMYGKAGDWPVPFGDGEAAARILDRKSVV